jgi:arylsulfatase A-like enzyme
MTQGRSAGGYDAIYGGYIDLQRMVFDGRYKLIYYPKIEKTRLYDLDQDPFEKNDLAENPDYQTKITDLVQKLKQLQQQTGDTLQI